MKSKKKKGPMRNGRLAHEAEGAAGGALVGAVVGAMAGPPGLVAGAILGAVAGAVTGAAMDNDSGRESQRTRELDAVIGVSGGDMGAPNLKHPPAKVGAYSAGSAGAAATTGAEPAEGPMPAPEE